MSGGLELLPVAGWRQHEQWRRRLKKALRYVNRACRSKGPQRQELVRRSYQALYDLTDQLLDRGRQLLVPARRVNRLCLNRCLIAHEQTSWNRR